MLRSSILVLLAVLTSSCHGSIFSRLPNRVGKIVGGETINIEEAPHQVSIFTERFGHTCGGSIISETLILTAAHCVSGSSVSLNVRAGSSYIDQGGQVVPVESFKYHEKFSYFSMDYDVALLRLNKPLKFNKFVSPIKVIDNNFTMADGIDAIVTGWGTTTEGGELPDVLQKVVVPVVNQKECQDAYGSFQPITDRMMCAGITVGGKDACQGDSGGPLTVSGFLAGVVSWGLGCARPDFPGVYTRLSALTEWIKMTSDEYEIPRH